MRARLTCHRSTLLATYFISKNLWSLAIFLRLQLYLTETLIKELSMICILQNFMISYIFGDFEIRFDEFKVFLSEINGFQIITRRKVQLRYGLAT